tara:strand:- start:4848 stop:5510 length:663 start_codon:yes stop_codon:yes gene_type:complete
MSQNKIPILIGDQKLFDTLSEIIVQINNQSNVKFDIAFYDQKTEISSSTIIIDQSALKFLGKENLDNDIKKIYLINNTKDSNAISHIKSEIITTNVPVYVNDFFDRVSNDITQEIRSNRNIINFNTFHYDFNSRSLFNEKNSLRFTEKENEIFSCLINYKNKPISKKKLLKDIWQYDDQIDTHTLETHIYSLRKKLETKLGLKNFLNHLDEGYQLDTSLL